MSDKSPKGKEKLAWLDSPPNESDKDSNPELTLIQKRKILEHTLKLKRNLPKIDPDSVYTRNKEFNKKKKGKLRDTFYDNGDGIRQPVIDDENSEDNPRFSSTIHALNSNWRNVDNLAMYTMYSQHADQRNFLMRKTIRESLTPKRVKVRHGAEDIMDLKQRHYKSFCL